MNSNSELDDTPSSTQQNDGIVYFKKAFYLSPSSAHTGEHLLNKFCDQLNAALMGLSSAGYDGYKFKANEAISGYHLFRGGDLISSVSGIYKTHYLYDSRLSVLYMQSLLRRTCAALEEDAISQPVYQSYIKRVSTAMHGDPRNKPPTFVNGY